MPVISRALLMFALDRGKFRAQDNQCPDNTDNPEDDIWLNHAKSLRLEIGVVKSRRLLVRDLVWTQFDSGKNESGSDQCAADGAERIEGLRKIEPLFRSIRIPQLGDERIGRSFEERQSAGDNKQGQKEETISARDRRRPKQKTTCRIQKKAGYKSDLVA